MLPPPEILERYEHLVPGSAKILLGLVGTQTAHRQHLERTAIHGEIRRSYLGLVVGGIIGLAALALGGYALYKGQSLAGVALVLLTLASYLASFFYGTNSRRQERVQKTNVMAEQLRLGLPDDEHQG